jgi:CelD/BcsL family acetyltransferase involved in cellulose biosynthesis
VVALEVIENTARLREFEPEWSRFVARVSPATPFQMPEWLATWWSHFGSGDLRVMVFRQGAEVAGVLPCFRHEWNGRRQLTLVGSRVSDYLDPLFEPQSVAGILEQVGRQLNSWTDWDMCDWQDLSRGTPLQVLGTALEETPCSALALDQPFEDFLATRPKDLRRNLRRYREKAEAIGCVKFEVSHAADDQLMDALIALHRVRWEQMGEPGMIEANRSEAFLREVAKLLASRGALRIFTVRFADRVAAILLALCNKTTIFSYLSAFDPQHESFGFGRELLAQAFRYAHETGYRCWNFLRGDEAYKFSWSAQLIAKSRVLISR